MSTPGRRFSYDRQCRGKCAYTSRSDARKAMRRIRYGHAGMAVYLCPWCDRWHIGHTPPAEYVNTTRDSGDPGRAAHTPGSDHDLDERPK